MASFIQVMAFPHYLNEEGDPGEEKKERHSFLRGDGFAENGEPERFTELVAALEAQACSRLNSPMREFCLAAYQAAPAGFEVLVKRAQEKARSNAIGLLIAMVKNREHLAGPIGLV